MPQNMNLLHLRALIFSTFVLLVSPLIVLILFLFYLRQILLKKLSHYLCPENGKMLNSAAHISASVDWPEMYESKTLSNILIVQIIDGHCDLLKVRQDFLAQIETKVKIVNRTTGQLEETEEFLYPELRQHVTSWMGHLFWRWDRNFKIENHVNLLTTKSLPVDLNFDPNCFGEKDIPKLLRHLPNAPFIKGQSPWELLILHCQDGHSKPVKSIGFVRFHHCLGDGFSIFKMFAGDEMKKIVDSISESRLKSNAQAKLNEEKKNWIQILFNWIWNYPCFPFRSNYESMLALLESFLPYDSWHLRMQDLTLKTNGAVSDPISIDLIKEIKKMYKTNFNCIVQAALTGGIRNFRLESDGKVPEKFLCVLPVPITRRSEKLRNQVTVVTSCLPLGIEDPRERVRLIDANLKKLIRSTLPISTLYTIKAFGCFPQILLKPLCRMGSISAILSNFPGPATPFTLPGGAMPSSMFFGGSGEIGMVVTGLSYNGQLRICVQVDDAILPEQRLVQKLVDKIQQEFMTLRNLEMV